MQDFINKTLLMRCDHISCPNPLITLNSQLIFNVGDKFGNMKFVDSDGNELPDESPEIETCLQYDDSKLEFSFMLLDGFQNTFGRGYAEFILNKTQGIVELFTHDDEFDARFFFKLI